MMMHPLPLSSRSYAWPRSLSVAVCLGVAPPTPTDVETDPLVLKKLETFQDWKFGLIMHWGIYSQWGCIESWPLVEEVSMGSARRLAGMDRARQGHEAVRRRLRETQRNLQSPPLRSADMGRAAKQAGMKYVMFTTKHHDGFCMFDTKQTDYRTTAPSCPFHTNPRADVVKAVFDAFRKAGFGIGAYYSKSDWHHPGYWDPARPHRTPNPNYDTAKEPDRWASFVKFTYDIIEELLGGYGPIDILWLDGGQVRPPQQDINMPRHRGHGPQTSAGLDHRRPLGRRPLRKLPHAGMHEVPPKALPCVWETCMTMGDQWSYKPNDKYKSSRQLIHLLVDIVAKGGNFLLNIGPDADGRLPAPPSSDCKPWANG